MTGLKRAIDLRGAISINVITMIGIGPLGDDSARHRRARRPARASRLDRGRHRRALRRLVWAELSSRYPGSGGTYVYLREVFGAAASRTMLAFLFNWQFLLYAPCLLASGYIGFANYAAFFYPPLGSSVPCTTRSRSASGS